MSESVLTERKVRSINILEEAKVVRRNKNVNKNLGNLW